MDKRVTVLEPVENVKAHNGYTKQRGPFGDRQSTSRCRCGRDCGGNLRRSWRRCWCCRRRWRRCNRGSGLMQKKNEYKIQVLQFDRNQYRCYKSCLTVEEDSSGTGRIATGFEFSLTQ